MIETTLEQIPDGWDIKKLSKLIYFTKGKKPKITSTNGEIPALLIKSLNNGVTEFTKDKQITLAEKNDVIMVMDGASSGKVYIGHYGAVGSTLGRYRPKDKDIISPFHLFYFLKENFQAISNNNIGAAIPHANKEYINEIDIALPPIKIQHKITSFIYAYDNLIDNNTHRIQILEDMAQAIYREWFIHFRFPGHEDIKHVETELGLIPEGWEYEPLGELLEHEIGGGWGKEEPDEDYQSPAFVIRGTDIPGARLGNVDNVPLRYHKLSNLLSRRLHDWDIVFEVSGGSKGQPVGRSLLISPSLVNTFNQEVMCASFCKLVRTNKRIAPQILFLHFLEIYENLAIMQYQVQSTGISNFKWKVFLSQEEILVPSYKIQKQFNKIITPIYELISKLGRKNKNLIKTRDLLLPRLISGDLDVSDLDIHIMEDLL